MENDCWKQPLKEFRKTAAAAKNEEKTFHRKNNA